MKRLNRFLLTFVLFFLLSGTVKATWSIIVIDPNTKEIGIAGASCTYSVYGIGGIIPGKGAVIVQAMSNKDARNKGLQMVLADASPEDILRAIKDPQFDPENQQYAIVCVNAVDKSQTYTGSNTTPSKGAVISRGISIQGNTLTNTVMLNKILQTVIQAQKQGLSIQEVLMLALETGAEYGGDKRCGDRKALSAFLTVARPGDDLRHPYINLIVNQSDDSTNAVKALRSRFNNWKNQQKN